MTKKLLASFFAFMFLWISTAAVFAQQSAEQSNIVKVSLSQAEVDKIVRAFSVKEAEFRQALNFYNFKRQLTIQSIGFGGQVTGEYRRDSLFVFDESKLAKGEKILFAPVPTLKAEMKAEDETDLNGLNIFALEPSKVAAYNFTFVGKEKIDELNLYVFDVAPKVMPNPKKSKERFFQGRIWIDDIDLQIVKTKGKGMPEAEDNKFPILETWRENIDGKYWFPSYAYANDQLYFEKGGNTLHLKMKVKFTEYKKSSADVRILDDGEVVEDTPADKPKTEPKKPQ